ncbi:MAG: hypothetical protein JRM85_09025, partial [Nitrososphaerota archaeon]|nr:hypothetical protein [Nitrososphaerota archaeon]
SLLSTGLSENERMKLMAKLHTIPFLWSEMVGSEDYFAEFYFPTENIVEGFQFLTGAIREVKGKTDVAMLDQSEALSFTFSYGLYNKDNKRWTFDESSLLSRFLNLVAQIKESGGP